MAKGKITLQSLAEIMSEKTDRSKSSSEQFLRNFFSIIKEALGKDNIVKIKGFGTFKMVVVNARESVNVNTGKRVSISEYNKITFTPDKNLKERINRPFAQFDSVLIDDEDISIINEDNDNKQPDKPAETPVENIKSETTVKVEVTPVATQDETTPQTTKATPVVDETVESESVADEPDPEEETPTKSRFNKSRPLILAGIIGLMVGLAFSYFYSTDMLNMNGTDNKMEATLQKKQLTQKDEKTATTPLQDSLSTKRNKFINEYPQLSEGEYYITGVKTYRKIKPDYNLRRYCLQIYGKADVIPYVLLLNNLLNEGDATVGKVITFPVLEEKTIYQ